jgi:hypothetical protein
MSPLEINWLIQVLSPLKIDLLIMLMSPLEIGKLDHTGTEGF